jgi:transcriptional regulator with XRE-family HTH domain
LHENNLDLDQVARHDRDRADYIDLDMWRRKVPERSAPSVRGRQLARELRRLREAAGLTGEAAAVSLGWSSAKVSRIETARTPVAASDLPPLLALYGATGAEAERLEWMAQTARERGWWRIYADDLPSEYTTYIGLEAEASSVTYYLATVLPGLLQTEDYARAVLQSIILLPPGEVERRVQVRRTRQRRLDETDGTSLNLLAVLDESVLRRRVGGLEVMRDQLGHLVDLAGHPNIAIQVLPYSAGAHAATSGPFTILTVPHYRDTEIVYVELMGGGLFIEDEQEVYRYTLVIDDLRAAALDTAESIAFINKIITEL